VFVIIEACVEVTRTGDISLSYNTIPNDDSFCKSCGTPKVRTLVSGLIVLSQDNCNAKKTGKALHGSEVMVSTISTWRVENPKKTVPRGVLYCHVPLCHSYKGKIVDGKKVQLHRLPKDTKAKRLWIAKLRNVRKKFLLSLERGSPAYTSKVEMGRSRGVSFQRYSLQSQSWNLLFKNVLYPTEREEKQRCIQQ